jgi:hypothetical protein
MVDAHRRIRDTLAPNELKVNMVLAMSVLHDIVYNETNITDTRLRSEYMMTYTATDNNTDIYIKT